MWLSKLVTVWLLVSGTLLGLILGLLQGWTMASGWCFHPTLGMVAVQARVQEVAARGIERAAGPTFGRTATWVSLVEAAGPVEVWASAAGQAPKMSWAGGPLWRLGPIGWMIPQDALEVEHLDRSNRRATQPLPLT